MCLSPFSLLKPLKITIGFSWKKVIAKSDCSSSKKLVGSIIKILSFREEEDCFWTHIFSKTDTFLWVMTGWKKKKKLPSKLSWADVGEQLWETEGLGDMYRPLLSVRKFFFSQNMPGDYWQPSFWCSSQLFFPIQMLSPSPFHLGDCSFSHMLLSVPSPLVPLSQQPPGFTLCPSWSQAIVSQVLLGAWLWVPRGQDTFLASPAEMGLQFPAVPLLSIRLRAHFLRDTAISWLHLKWQQGS